MGFLATVAAASGEALSDLTAIGQGLATKAVADAQARQANIEATRAEQLGRLEADRARRDGSRIAGSQRAVLASRGLLTGAGTANFLADDARTTPLLNASLAENQANARAFSLRSQGAITRFQGKVARDVAFMNFASSRLRSAGNFGMSGGQSGGLLSAFSSAGGGG